VKSAAFLACVAAAAAWPNLASAEIVRLTSGATLSVKSAVVSGDSVVLALRGGGEMRAPRALVAEVLPDEVLHADAETTFVLPAYRPAAATSVEDLVGRTAAEFGVPEKLAHALVRVESNYRADAVSPKGAMGLMQLMPALAKYYGVDDPFDPEQNLRAGMQHLRSLLDRFGNDTATALAAYNAGEPAIAKYGTIPPYRETQGYVRRIMSLVKER
jgi:soluble lytic murein transglycosylase-like protein